jgi:type I restriction enzyme S subunit
VIADLKPYADYKDSGMPWLGQVPNHWETRPAFGAFVPNHDRNRGMKERTVLSLSYGRIVIKPMEKLHGLVPESFESYQIVNPGDIVLRTTDLQNDHTSLRVGIVRDRGIITSAYLALRTSAGINPEFGFQFLNVWDSSKAIYGYGSGLRQSLDFSHFKRMPVAVPPPDEQAAIVRFLVWANGRLERAIRSKRKVITLLNEQKQAIIHRAVTRGLDPSVALKPSGIPWLGDIPEHWQLARACTMFRQVTRFSAEGDEPKMSMSRRYGLIRSSELSNRAAQAASSIKFSVCIPGDLVLNKYQAHNGLFGAAIERGLITSNYSVFAPIANLNTEFFSALFTSPPYRTEFRMRCQGVGDGMMPLYSQAFLKTPVIIPPTTEQNEIVAHVNDATKGISQAITRIEREIALVQEYRIRLATDVVTGKRDVREAAARLPEEVPLGTVEDAADLSEDLDVADEEATA